jgi:hypothetical protein
MGDVGAEREDKRDLSEERAELLPDRTTLAAVEFGKNQFNPDTFTVSSPASNNAVVDAHAESQVAGGFMPIVITVVPSFNVIVQNSGPDGLGAGHPAAGGHADPPPAGDGNVQPHADGGSMNGSPADNIPADSAFANFARFLDFLRRWL